MRPLFAMFIAFALLPSAAAFELTATAPSETLDPGQGATITGLTATATCEEVRERQVPTPDNPVTGASSLSIAINGSSPEGIRLSLPDALTLQTQGCASDPEGSVSTDPVDVSMSVDLGIAGLVSYPYSITAELEGGDLGEPTSASWDDEVDVGYQGSLEVVVDQPVKVISEGQPQEFTFTLTNLGNADTVVHFELNAPAPKGILVELPPDTTVPYDPAGQDNQATATIRTSTDPDAEGEVLPLADLAVRGTSWAEADPTLTGSEFTQSLSIRIQDAKGAPAPTALLVAPALLAAAFVARRRA